MPSTTPSLEKQSIAEYDVSLVKKMYRKTAGVGTYWHNFTGILGFRVGICTYL